MSRCCCRVVVDGAEAVRAPVEEAWGADGGLGLVEQVLRGEGGLTEGQWSPTSAATYIQSSQIVSLSNDFCLLQTFVDQIFVDYKFCSSEMFVDSVSFEQKNEESDGDDGKFWIYT